MSTINQSDKKSSNKGPDDNKNNQSTRQLSKLRSSSRPSGPFIYPSSIVTSYDSFFVNDDGSSSITSSYGHPDFKDYGEQNDMDTQFITPDSAREPSILSELQYPSGQQIYRHQQLEQRQQQHYQELRLQEEILHQQPIYHSSQYDQHIEDDSDHDADRDIKQDDFPVEHVDHGSSRSSQRLPHPQSAHELHSSNFISEDEFLVLAEDYLMSLSPKKREKALLTNIMYQKVLMVLLQPKNTQISTAQFRFWARKMFTLSTTETHHIVCHDGKPVATKECLYDVLIYCHRKSSHGGRDKTSAEVRQHYSWVPKELIARFVKHCPLCSSRRHSLQRPPSALGTSSGYDPFSLSSTTRFQTSEDNLLRHNRHQGQPQQIQDPAQPDSAYTRQHQDHSIDRSYLVLLQQQHGLYPQLEQQNQPNQHRTQFRSSLGRYYGEPNVFRPGHSHSSSGSIHMSANVNSFARSQLDDSGISLPTKRHVNLQLGLSRELHRNVGWSKSNRAVEADHDGMKNEDGDMKEGDGSDVNGCAIQSENRSSALLRFDDQPFSGSRHIVDIPDDDDKEDNCVPSGLVGIPQELGRSPFEPIQQQFQISSSQQSRQEIQQQQQDHHSTYPLQHAHDIFQQRYPSSSGSQSRIAATVYHPNGHVLHSRHPMHHLSVGQTGYTYGHPYPYNPTVGPGNMVFNQSKVTQGLIPIFPQQQVNATQSTHSSDGHPFAAALGTHQRVEGFEEDLDEADMRGNLSGGEREIRNGRANSSDVQDNDTP